jgi:transcriptional regulator with XRE-family HTH domain
VQIRALRLKSVDPPMPYQRDLAKETELHQSRISMFESPGAANMTLETLAKIAAGLRVGVLVKFVPFSDMLAWENQFSPDRFDIRRLAEDEAFINPEQESLVQGFPPANAVEEFAPANNGLTAIAGKSKAMQGALSMSTAAFGASSQAIGGAA